MTLALNVVTSYATRRSHEAVLRLVEDLSEEQLKEQSSTTSPSIAFHVWHVARWADLLQSRMPGMTAEPPNRRNQSGSRALLPGSCTSVTLVTDAGGEVW